MKPGDANYSKFQFLTENMLFICFYQTTGNKDLMKNMSWNLNREVKVIKNVSCRKNNSPFWVKCMEHTFNSHQNCFDDVSMRTLPYGTETGRYCSNFDNSWTEFWAVKQPMIFGQALVKTTYRQNQGEKMFLRSVPNWFCEFYFESPKLYFTSRSTNPACNVVLHVESNHRSHLLSC